MIKLLEHKDVKAACRGAALFTIMLSNNSEVQKATAAKGGLEVLFKFVDRGEEAFFCGLSMFGALIRHEPDLETKFVETNGNDLLTKALSADQPLCIRTKGASLLRHLLVAKVYGNTQYTDVLDKFAQCVADILPLDFDHIQYGDIIAALTSTLYVVQPRSRSRCETGVKNLVEAANVRIAALKAIMQNHPDEDRSAEIDLLEDLDSQRRMSEPPKREDIMMIQG